MEVKHYVPIFSLLLLSALLMWKPMYMLEFSRLVNSGLDASDLETHGNLLLNQLKILVQKNTNPINQLLKKSDTKELVKLMTKIIFRTNYRDYPSLYPGNSYFMRAFNMLKENEQDKFLRQMYMTEENRPQLRKDCQEKILYKIDKTTPNLTDTEYQNLPRRKVHKCVPTNFYNQTVYKRLPDIITIGSKKCSTTAFTFFMSLHPNFKTKLLEPHQFDIDGHYEKGIERYFRYLPWVEDYKKDVVHEKTPRYMINK